MKRQPPRYELDNETRELARRVIEWAELVGTVQITGTDAPILAACENLRQRLGLPPTPPPLGGRAEVVPLRPFRVVGSEERQGDR